MRTKLILILLFFYLKGFTQENVQENIKDRAFFDSLTYNQFIAQDYKSVIKNGKKALKHNVDFYYLRYRMAFSAFELKNYVKSIPHFKAMLEMNPSDTLAQEYLYYAYIETNQDENALIISSKFEESLKNRLKIKRKIVDNLALNFGLLTNDNVKKNKDVRYISKNVKGASETKLNSGLTIFDLSSNLNFTNQFQTDINISYVNSKSLLKGEVDDKTYLFETKNNNFQANIVLSYLFKNNTKINLGYAYFNNDVSTLKNIPPVKNVQNVVVVKPYFTDTLINYKSNLLSLKVSKTGKIVNSFLALSYSELYRENFLQINAGLHYLIKGSYNLYGTSAVFVLKGLSNPNLVFQQNIGFKIYKFIWLENSVMLGNMQNVSAENGILTFNTSDPIKMNLGSDLLLKFKQFSIIPSYRYQIRSFTTSKMSEGKSTTTAETPYSNHLINLTFKWHF